MTFRFMFESAQDGNYVGVLSRSRLVHGNIASQDAGSSNSGIYYQVGGLGVNGYFAAALGDKLAPVINQDLVSAYDVRFGDGAWKSAQQASNPPLTSLYIPLPANAHTDGFKVGTNVAGIVYSVGPALSSTAKTFPDPALYRQIYVDAFAELARANAAGAKIDALRLTMVSTGIYGGPALAGAAATLILDALEAASKSAGAANLPATLLVNNSEVAPNQPNKERNAFTTAAKARGIKATAKGFDFDPA